MKNLVGVLMVMSFGSMANACYSEPTKAQTKTMLVSVTDYFADSIAGKDNISISSLDLSVVDCHDYDAEFSAITVELKWRQKPKDKEQTCAQELTVNDQGIDYKDTIHCRND